MSIRSLRKLYAAAFCTLAAGALSLPAIAGGGPDCQSKMTRMNVEGNGDATISAAAHAAGADKRFDAMDANGDGRITGAEIEASHGAESTAWAKHRMSSAQKIRKLDSDNDGALTRAEYVDGSQKMFRKLDADGDGYLTAAEMQGDSTERLTALEAD